jgi:anti-anti-sigma factor
MLEIKADNLDGFTVVECRGRIVRDESVFKLRDFVLDQEDANTILLDLSQVKEMGGAGVGMLAYLEHWAREQSIELKLFSPSKEVMKALLQNGAIDNFEIVNIHELQVMIREDNHFHLAA